MAGLWSMHVLMAQGDAWVTPALRMGFLFVTGAVTAYVTWRAEHSARQIRRQHEAALRSLDRLERDFDEARRFGKIGENAALLAHGFKNSVHSLRGYTRLIEPRLAGSRSDRDLIDGLTCAIDGLEDLARTALGAGISPRSDGSGTSAEKGRCVVRDVVREIGAAFPEVRWSLALPDLPPLDQPFRSIIREALTIVVRNSAEAMQGRGLVAVEASRRNGTLEIHVRDNGPGLASSAHGAIFQPGCTTKPDGHGLGLFLARRALEARGGLLSLSAAEGGGTLCRIELPLGGRAIEQAIGPHR
jgi:signal transduction histidine kinase